VQNCSLRTKITESRDQRAKLRNCGIIPVVCRFMAHTENCNMPTTVSLYLIGVWFCVGFFTGAGWALAAWIVGRFLRF
jgi:hypothetical protein